MKRAEDVNGDPRALPASPEAPAFVHKGGPPRPATPAADAPKIDPDLGLGWLQKPDRDAPPPDPAGGQTRMVRPPRKSGPRVQADLFGKQQVQGQHVGDRYVRVVRQQSDDFERAGPGHLVATEEALEARGPVGRAFGRVKRIAHRRAADDRRRPPTSA